MSYTVVMGTQWGDEGKGKIIHLLSEEADVIVRFSSADIPGHTVFYNDTKYKLHFIPVGVFYPDKIAVLGNGMVIDLGTLTGEMDYLKNSGLTLENLKISSMAHIILPYHKILDQLEAEQEPHSIRGRTRKGVISAYIDKVARRGIRIMDLLDKDIFKEKLKTALDEKNKIFKKLYSISSKGFDIIYNDYMHYRDAILPYVADTPFFLNELTDEKVLFEGVQGTLMDVDFGTYPFVGSSNFTVGAGCTGSGIPPTKIKNILGVTKSYTTRVGAGPYPTELLDDEGEELRAAGGEYGSTTGRPRRCGWLDLPMIRYSAIVNGLTGLVVTKLDVLDDFETIKVCTGYKYGGKVYKNFPLNLKILEKCEPIYKEFPGWEEDTIKIKNYSGLPQAARDYLEFIEKEVGVKICMISVGQQREQTIIKNKIW